MDHPIRHLSPAELTAHAEAAVRQLREDYDFHTAPVDCFRLVQIIQERGEVDLTVVEDPRLSGRVDARAQYFSAVDAFLIIMAERPFQWKQYSRWRRCNFTLAHELGHIFCGHLSLPDEMRDEEIRALEDREADAFAARLLMPPEVLAQFRSVQEAADGLWVSESAIRRRLRETGISFARRVCPRCGFGAVPPGARFCRKCGLKLKDGPNAETAPEIAFLPPRPHLCPFCGQAAIGGEEDCLKCGMPRRNLCIAEYNQPRHPQPADAAFCEICGAETEYRNRG